MKTSTIILLSVGALVGVTTIIYLANRKPVVEDKSANENKGYVPVQSTTSTSNNTQNNSSATETEELATVKAELEIINCKKRCNKKWLLSPYLIAICRSKCK